MCILEPLETTHRVIGVSADSLGFPDAEYFNGLDLAPATKRGRPCALWSHLQGYMGYQKIHKKCHIQNLLLVGTYLAPKPWTLKGHKGVCNEPPEGLSVSLWHYRGKM